MKIKKLIEDNGFVTFPHKIKGIDFVAIKNNKEYYIKVKRGNIRNCFEQLRKHDGVNLILIVPYGQRGLNKYLTDCDGKNVQLMFSPAQLFNIIKEKKGL